jgi:nicotinate-nucleotide adenylyltransferase
LSKPVGFLGGTFDPIHNGHLWLAREGLAKLGLERVVFLPAGHPYQRGREPYASAAQRLEMLKLALPAQGTFSIDARELHRSGPTYTFDTLQQLRAELGSGLAFVWLMGADTFARLDSWHRWRELFGLTHFAVFRRAGVDTFEAVASAPLRGVVAAASALPQAATGSVWFLDVMPPDISSTGIRDRMRRGEPVRGMVPDSVLDYIQQHQLYSREGDGH